MTGLEDLEPKTCENCGVEVEPFVESGENPNGSIVWKCDCSSPLYALKTITAGGAR